MRIRSERRASARTPVEANACPLGTPRYCKGSVRLARAAALPHGATGQSAVTTRGRTLGHGTFQLQPGAASRVSVRLSGHAKGLLRRHRKIEVVIRTWP